MFLNGLVAFKNSISFAHEVSQGFMEEYRMLSGSKGNLDEDFELRMVDLFTGVMDGLILFVDEMMGLKINRIIYSDEKKSIGFGFDYTVNNDGVVGVFGIEAVEGLNDLLSRRDDYRNLLTYLFEEIKEHNLPVDKAPHPLIDKELLSVGVGLEKQNYSFKPLCTYHDDVVEPVDNDLLTIIHDNKQVYCDFMTTVRQIHDNTFINNNPLIRILINVSKGDDKYLIIELNNQQEGAKDYERTGCIYKLDPVKLYKPFSIEKFVAHIQEKQRLSKKDYLK